MSVAVSAIASGFEGCLGCYGERDKAVDAREKKQEQTRNKLGDLGVFGGGTRTTVETTGRARQEVKETEKEEKIDGTTDTPR